MFSRITVFAYGVACYLVFFATFLYAIAFIGDFGVGRSLDGSPRIPALQAVAIDTALLGLFAVQHSVMARQWFKKALTRVVPAAAERSTYVLFSSLALIVLFWKWQAIGGVIWSVEHPVGRLVIQGIYFAGWAVVLITTFLINHFDLFGLRQVWINFRGHAYTALAFRTPGPYKFVRHPLYVGWLMVFWAAPVMTAAHLLFAVATTAYILIAIQLEERDLVRFHPEYEEYRQHVPMLIPAARQSAELHQPSLNVAERLH